MREPPQPHELLIFSAGVPAAHVLQQRILRARALLLARAPDLLLRLQQSLSYACQAAELVLSQRQLVRTFGRGQRLFGFLAGEARLREVEMRLYEVWADLQGGGAVGDDGGVLAQLEPGLGAVRVQEVVAEVGGEGLGVEADGGFVVAVLEAAVMGGVGQSVHECA